MGRSAPVGAKYDKTVNRESAAEMLAARADHKAADAPPATARGGAAPAAPEEGGIGQAMKDALFGTKRRQGMVETMAKQTARTMGSQVGRQILRGVLGSIFGGKR